MAYIDPTYIGPVNKIGRQHEDIGTFTTGAGVTSGTIRTRLTSINEIHIQAPGTASVREVTVYPNSATASFTEDDPGEFAFANATASRVYYYRAAGR